MTDPQILRNFRRDYLPARAVPVSREFEQFAYRVAAYPANPERAVMLRKLLEAQDAAVRCILYDNHV